MSDADGYYTDPDRRGQLPLNEGQYQYYPRFFPTWSWASGSGTPNMAYSGDGQFYVIGEDGMRVEQGGPAMSGRMYDNATYLGYKSQRAGGSYKLKPPSEMTDSTDYFSKGANKRRCCVIASIVGLFFLVAAGITIGIYFGVVDKPDSKKVTGTTPTPPTAVAFDMEMTQDVPYDTNLDNPSSPEYQALKTDVEAQVDAAFANSELASAYLSNTVSGFSPGSTIIYFKAAFKSTQTPVGNQIVQINNAKVTDELKAGFRRTVPTFANINSITAAQSSSTVTGTVDLGERCSSVTDCQDKNTNCIATAPSTEKLCTCQQGYYDTNEGITGGTCLTKKAYQVTCRRASECVTTGSECSSQNTCLCPSNNYYDGSSACFPKIPHGGAGCTDAGNQCVTTNAVCLSGSCSCAASHFLRGQECFEKILFGQGTCISETDCLTKDAACDAGTCVCVPAKYRDIIADECKPKLVNGQSCTSKQQCLVTDASCDTTCKCEDGDYEANGACLSKKVNGASCSSAGECLNSGAGCINSVCVCPPLTTYEDGTVCSNKKSLNETCTADVQCSTKNSTCSTKCSCASDTYFDVTTNTCLNKKLNGVSCSGNVQCLATKAFCDANRQYTCQCPLDNYLSGTACLQQKINTEACTSVDECGYNNTDCIGNVCKCPENRYEEGTECKLKIANGKPCSKSTQCAFPGAVCETVGNTCACLDTSYEDVTECLPKIINGGACSTKGQCAFNASDCIQQKCSCSDAQYEVTQDKACLPKKVIGESCDSVGQCLFPEAECSATCNCPETHFKDGDTCTLRKANGLPCTTKDECSVSNAICSGTCKCSDTSVLIEGVCKPLVAYLGACDVKEECSTDQAVCEAKQCVCPANFFKDDEDKCSQKLNNGETCELDSNCAFGNAACSAKQCTCPSTRYANETNKMCELKKDNGDTCADAIECKWPSAQCITTQCGCLPTAYDNGTACLDKVDNGVACTKSLECKNEGAVCDSDKVCSCINGHYLDGTVCKPKVGNGQPCNTSLACSVDKATCINNKCECVSTQYLDGTKCSDKKGFGELCNNKTECAFVDASCSTTCKCNSTFYFDGSICRPMIAYNNSCSGSDIHCLTSNAKCLDSKCKCDENNYYDLQNDTCYIKAAIGGACKDRSNCITKDATCSNLICGCSDDRYPSVSGCLLKKENDVPCSSKAECKVTNATCNVVCTCADDNYLEDDSCKPKKINKEPCTNTFECAYNNSVCEASTCQCSSNMYEMGTSCYPEKPYGQACILDKECSSDVSGCVNSYCGCTDGFYVNGAQCLAKVIYGGSCPSVDACSTKKVDCINNTCTCPADYYLSGNECLQKIGAGQVCQDDTQCSVNASVCLGGFCTCPATMYLNANETACLPKKGAGESCSLAKECEIVNSACTNKQCVCSSDDYNNGTHCLPKKVNGSPCADVKECKLENSVCQATVCACSGTDYENGNQCSPRVGYGGFCSGDMCMSMFVCTAALSCGCNQGEVYNGSYCELIPTTTPIPTTVAPDPVVTVDVEGELASATPFNEDLKNTSSDLYKKTEEEVRNALIEANKEDPSVADIIIEGFKSDGSRKKRSILDSNGRQRRQTEAKTLVVFRIVVIIVLVEEVTPPETQEDVTNFDVVLLIAVKGRFNKNVPALVALLQSTQSFSEVVAEEVKVSQIKTEPCKDPATYLRYAQSGVCKDVLKHFLSPNDEDHFCRSYNNLLKCIFNAFTLDGEICEDANYGRAIFEENTLFSLTQKTKKDVKKCIRGNKFSFKPNAPPTEDPCTDLTTQTLVMEYRCNEMFNDVARGDNLCRISIGRDQRSSPIPILCTRSNETDIITQKCILCTVSQLEGCSWDELGTIYPSCAELVPDHTSRLSQMVDGQSEIFLFESESLTLLECEFCIAPNLIHILNEDCHYAFSDLEKTMDVDKQCSILHEDMYCVKSLTSEWSDCPMTAIHGIMTSEDGYKRLPEKLRDIIVKEDFDSCLAKEIQTIGKAEPADLCEDQTYIWYLLKHKCSQDMIVTIEDLKCSMTLPTYQCVVDILNCDFNTVLFRAYGNVEINDNNIVNLLPAEYANCDDAYTDAFATIEGKCHLASFRELYHTEETVREFMNDYGNRPAITAALQAQDLKCGIIHELLNLVKDTMEREHNYDCPIQTLEPSVYMLLYRLELITVIDIGTCQYDETDDICSSPTKMMVDSILNKQCGRILTQTDQQFRNDECSNYLKFKDCMRVFTDCEMKDVLNTVRHPTVVPILHKFYSIPSKCLSEYDSNEGCPIFEEETCNQGLYCTSHEDCGGVELMDSRCCNVGCEYECLVKDTYEFTIDVLNTPWTDSYLDPNSVAAMSLKAGQTDRLKQLGKDIQAEFVEISAIVRREDQVFITVAFESLLDLYTVADLTETLKGARYQKYLSYDLDLCYDIDYVRTVATECIQENDEVEALLAAITTDVSSIGKEHCRLFDDLISCTALRLRSEEAYCNPQVPTIPDSVYQILRVKQAKLPRKRNEIDCPYEDHSLCSYNVISDAFYGGCAQDYFTLQTTDKFVPTEETCSSKEAKDAFRDFVGCMLVANTIRGGDCGVSELLTSLQQIPDSYILKVTGPENGLDVCLGDFGDDSSPCTNSIIVNSLAKKCYMSYNEPWNLDITKIPRFQCQLLISATGCVDTQLGDHECSLDEINFNVDTIGQLGSVQDDCLETILPGSWERICYLPFTKVLHENYERGAKCFEFLYGVVGKDLTDPCGLLAQSVQCMRKFIDETEIPCSTDEDIRRVIMATIYGNSNLYFQLNLRFPPDFGEQIYANLEECPDTLPPVDLCETHSEDLLADIAMVKCTEDLPDSDDVLGTCTSLETMVRCLKEATEIFEAECSLSQLETAIINKEAQFNLNFRQCEADESCFGLLGKEVLKDCTRGEIAYQMDDCRLYKLVYDCVERGFDRIKCEADEKAIPMMLNEAYFAVNGENITVDSTCEDASSGPDKPTTMCGFPEDLAMVTSHCNTTLVNSDCDPENITKLRTCYNNVLDRYAVDCPDEMRRDTIDSAIMRNAGKQDRLHAIICFGSRPGYCPLGSFTTSSDCSPTGSRNECYLDSDCVEESAKCCSNGCNFKCTQAAREPGVYTTWIASEKKWNVDYSDLNNPVTEEFIKSLRVHEFLDFAVSYEVTKIYLNETTASIQIVISFASFVPPQRLFETIRLFDLRVTNIEFVKQKTEHGGICPSQKTDMCYTYDDQCQDDSICTDTEKCCYDGCIKKCTNSQGLCEDKSVIAGYAIDCVESMGQFGDEFVHYYYKEYENCRFISDLMRCITDKSWNNVYCSEQEIYQIFMEEKEVLTEYLRRSHLPVERLVFHLARWDYDTCTETGDVHPCRNRGDIQDAVQKCYEGGAMMISEVNGVPDTSSCRMYLKLASCVQIILTKHEERCYDNYDFHDTFYDVLRDLHPDKFPEMEMPVEYACKDVIMLCTAEGLREAARYRCMNPYLRAKTGYGRNPLTCRNESDVAAVKDTLVCLQLKALANDEEDCNVQKMVSLVKSDQYQLDLVTELDDCVSEDDLASILLQLQDADSVCQSPLAYSYISKGCTSENGQKCLAQGLNSPHISNKASCLLYYTEVSCIEQELRNRTFNCGIDTITSEKFQDTLSLKLNATQREFCTGQNFRGADFEACTYPLIAAMNASEECYKHLFNISKDLDTSRKCSMYYLTRKCWSNSIVTDANNNCDQSQMADLMPALLDAANIRMQAAKCPINSNVRTNFSVMFADCPGQLPDFDLCSDTSELRNRTLLDIVNASCSGDLKKLNHDLTKKSDNITIDKTAAQCMLFHQYATCGAQTTENVTEKCTTEQVSSALTANAKWLGKPFDNQFDLHVCAGPCHNDDVFKALDECMRYSIIDRLSRDDGLQCRFYSYLISCVNNSLATTECEAKTLEGYVRARLLTEYYYYYDQYDYYPWTHCKAFPVGMCSKEGITDLAVLGKDYCHEFYQLQESGCKALPNINKCFKTFTQLYGDCESSEEEDTLVQKAIMKASISRFSVIPLRDCYDRKEGYCSLDPFFLYDKPCVNRNDTCYIDHQCEGTDICCYDGCRLKCVPPVTTPSTFSLSVVLKETRMENEYYDMNDPKTLEFIDSIQPTLSDILELLVAEDIRVEYLGSLYGNVQVNAIVFTFVNLNKNNYEYTIQFEEVFFGTVEFVELYYSAPGDREGDCPGLILPTMEDQYCGSDRHCDEPQKCCYSDSYYRSVCTDPVFKDAYPDCEDVEHVKETATECKLDLLNVESQSCRWLLSQ